LELAIRKKTTNRISIFLSTNDDKDVSYFGTLSNLIITLQSGYSTVSNTLRTHI